MGKKYEEKRNRTLGIAGDKVARGIWPFLNDFSTERWQSEEAVTGASCFMG